MGSRRKSNTVTTLILILILIIQPEHGNASRRNFNQLQNYFYCFSLANFSTNKMHRIPFTKAVRDAGQIDLRSLMRIVTNLKYRLHSSSLPLLYSYHGYTLMELRHHTSEQSAALRKVYAQLVKN